MNVLTTIINQGVTDTDGLLVKRGKQIFNFDILAGIGLPLISELILQVSGYNTYYFTCINLLISLSFVPHLFLMRHNKYGLSVALIQLSSFIAILWAVIWGNALLDSLFFIALALNPFIYFPKQKKLTAAIFIFFISAASIGIVWETTQFELMAITGEELLRFRMSAWIFCFLFTYKIFSLIMMYWGILSEKEASQEALQASEARYRSFFEKVKVGIATEKDGTLISVNPEFCKLMGYEEEELVGMRPSNFVHPDELERVQMEFQEAMRNPLASREISHRAITKSGKIIDLLITFAPLKEEVKNDEEIIVTMINLTPMKKAEEALVKQEALIRQNLIELQQKNADLEKYIESNLQLENFAYIASHDLKAPIRTIGSFSKLLKRKAASKLDASELEFLDFINKGAENMQKLVEDLLTYSKANTENHHLDLINFPNLLEMIQHELSVSILENNAKLICENLPKVIYADNTKMRQLFQNMIANAIKFKKASVQPVVHISSHEDQEFWHFSVKDNGIGVKAEFHEKIFQLFRKLHGANEYEGSGIGLSLCRRIVEQHYGEISIDSEFGEYTQFNFSIRKF